MNIPVVVPDDYLWLSDLWTLAGLTVDLGDEESTFLWSMRHHGDHDFVAEEHQELIGPVLGAVDGRRGWIYHLTVAPSWQHHGLGAILINMVELSLHVAGCRKTNVLVDGHNRAVIPLYFQTGYNQANILFMEKIIHPTID